MPTSHETRECPLCGEHMRRKELEIVERIPGTSEGRRRKMSEWVCPECDYFEEIEGEGTAAGGSTPGA